jgi:ATP-binding cassette, subfamily B, bacterial PglK
MKYLKEILFLMGDDKWKLPLILMLFIAMSILEVLGIGLIAPYAALIINPDILTEKYSFLLNFGVPIFSENILFIMSLVLISVFIIKTLGLTLINWVIFTFCYNRQVKIRAELMKSYQAMSYIEYTKRNSAEYIYNIDLVASFTQGTLISILRITTEVIVGSLIFLFLVFQDAFVLFMLMILLGSFAFIYDFIFRKKITQYGKLLNIYSTDMFKNIKESVTGLKEVRILGKEDFFFDKVIKNTIGLSKAMKMSDFISSIPRYFLELLMISFVVLLVVFYSLQEKNLELVVPVLTMFSVAAIRLFPSVNQIVSGISHIRFGRPAVSLLYEDIKNSENIIIEKPLSNMETSPEFESIEVNKISFSYPTRDYKVINDLSFKIKKADSIGIIGPSGSGKTTLLDILLGLIEVDTGSILYNGKDLIEHQQEWKSHVAYIPQNIFIIDDNVVHNVALGIPDELVDFERLNNAIDQSRLRALMKQMPDGIYTMLGESGVQLSGGQRQRIALARAFYHNRNVIVMDEATSALDNETEKEIVDEINNLKGEKTLIVIAHRLSTVKHCDYIYRIEKGIIVDHGDYSSVVGNE